MTTSDYLTITKFLEGCVRKAYAEYLSPSSFLPIAADFIRLVEKGRLTQGDKKNYFQAIKLTPQEDRRIRHLTLDEICEELEARI